MHRFIGPELYNLVVYIIYSCLQCKHYKETMCSLQKHHLHEGHVEYVAAHKCTLELQ